ncbi:hypothetical protein BDR03DRAFT_986673, partial [Suillus americanus]
KGRSKTNNDKQISKILTLKRTLSNLDDSVRALEMQLCAGNTLNNVDFNLRLADERTHRSKVADTLRRWKASLGIGQLNDLQQLRRSIFLQICLDVQAVKARLREHLRQHKFEIERFERSYRQTVNEHKLHVHAEASIQRHNPTIRKLVTTYNNLCDDDIWQDVGLDSNDMAPPAWLADENMRTAIKFQLEEWMMAEWDALQEARTRAAAVYDSENDWESDEGRENDELIDELEEAALAGAYIDLDSDSYDI